MNSSVTKQLKNKDFKLLDSSICAVAFVVFQIVFELFRDLLKQSGATSNLFVAIILSVLVEAVFFFAALTTAGIKKVDFFEATKLNKKIDYLSGLMAFAISFLCIFGFNGLTNIFIGLLQSLGYTQTVSDVVIPNFATYLLYTFLLCIVPAICEETCFRGCILNGLRPLGDKKAVWISAAIFMLMHGGPDQTVHQLIVGAVCGYALIYSGSLWVPIIIHFFNNFIAISMIYFEGMAEASTDGAANVTQTTIVFSVILNIIIAIATAYIVITCLRKLKDFRENRENKAGKTLQTSEPVTIQEGGTAVIKDKKAKLIETRLTIALFSVAGAYLVINWIYALIVGFLI